MEKLFATQPIDTQPLLPSLQSSIKKKPSQDGLNLISAEADGINSIARHLTEFGYVVLPSPLPVSLVNDLFSHFKSRDDSAFKQGGIGRKRNYQLNPQVRCDEIHWLTRNHPITRAYLDWMELLRLELNRYLFLGLFEYECHYAYYPVGGFYKKHWDAFKGGRNRVVSTIGSASN